MISAQRMLQEVASQLKRQKLRANRLKSTVEILEVRCRKLRWRNRALREQLGVSRAKNKADIAERRAWRKAQMRLPL